MTAHRLEAESMADPTLRWLRELERRKLEFTPDVAPRKLELLRALERRRLARASHVLRLHEVLCFLRAYPDDAALLAQVERMLEGFEARGDLRRFRRALVDTGIAGTDVHFQFFPPTAFWLGRRWGAYLSVDWSDFTQHARLEELLPQLALFVESQGLDGYDLGSRGWIDALKGPDETDAAFLLRRLEQLRMSETARETLLEGLQIWFRLAPGHDTPTRTREKIPPTSITFQSRPLQRSRPSLREEILRPPASIRSLPTRSVPSREGRRWIDLARAAMVPRARDLQAFAYGHHHDVRLIDCEQGLWMALIGVIPEQRFLLETLYGFLLLKNGVPVGYGSYTVLFGSVETAFTIFDTYRSAEAAWIYARVLAVARRLFRCDTFTIDAYQIGQDNADAIRSGAWWFYQKMGFRPRSASRLRLMRQEERAMRRDPTHRSTAHTLRELASENLFLDLRRPRDDVMGVLAFENLGLRVTAFLAERFGSDRRRAETECAREAMRRLGVRIPPRVKRGAAPSSSAGERLAWQRWGPLVLILPGLDRWSAADKRELAHVVTAKGGASELDYLLRFDRHRRLRQAIVALSKD
jgi:hypothetical protein